MSDEFRNLEISATLDSSDGLFLSLPENDIFGITAVSISMDGDEAVTFWERMEEVAEVGMTSMSFDGIYLEVETSSDDDPNIAPEWEIGGSDIYHSSVTFHVMEKHAHNNERIELVVDLKVFEDYLVEEDLLEESARRSARKVSSPAP